MIPSWGVYLGGPSPAVLDALLDASRQRDVDYEHVGSTIDREAWSHRPVHTESLVMGGGEEVFAAAVEGLKTWQCHPGIGASIFPQATPLEEGETVLVVLRVGPGRIVVPDRVVAVVDEPDRFGFAYGTLPGHHERGEESFIVERSGNEVRATLRIDAETASVPATLVRPLVERFQHRAALGYLNALKSFALARSLHNEGESDSPAT